METRTYYIILIVIVIVTLTTYCLPSQEKITTNSHHSNEVLPIAGSRGRISRNINHPDGTDFQNLKKAVCLLSWKSASENEYFGGTGFIVNSLNNSFDVRGNPKLFLLTSLHNDVPVGKHIEGITITESDQKQVFISFDYEVAHSLAKQQSENFFEDIRLTNHHQYNLIRTVWQVKLNPLVQDSQSDIALYEIEPFEDYLWSIQNSEIFQHVYALGWDIHLDDISKKINRNDFIANISHPGENWKKFMSTTSSNQSFIEPGIDIVEPSKKNIAIKVDNFYNSDEGSSGAPTFNPNKRVSAVLSNKYGPLSDEHGVYYLSKSSLLENSWYYTENEQQESNLQSILDPSLTYISSIKGGYLANLIPNEEVNDAFFNLEIDQTGISKQVYLNAFEFYRDFPDIFNNSNESILGHGILPADFSNNTIILTLKDNKDQIIYKAKYDNSMNSFYTKFKGKDVPVDSSNPFSTLDILTTDIKNNILNIMKEEYTGASEIKTIKTFLLNELNLSLRTESGTAKIRAIKLPHIMPYNARELFESHYDPDSGKVSGPYDNLWRSYKYHESRLNSKTLYIGSVDVMQKNEELETIPKTIFTGDNGGYLNLVNPNFKIGPIKASIDEQNKKSVKFKIELHNPNNQTFSYRVWIDYFKHKKEGGNTNLEENYTYNFVEDPEPHPEELLKEDTNISGNVIEFEEELPLYSAIVLNKNDKRLTRLRIAVKTGGIPPTQSEKIGVGEVEDYLIEIAAPTDSELEEIELEKVFDKISMADGSSENAGISPPQGESGNRLGSGNDDASINNDLAFLYNDNTNQNLEMADFLVDFGDAINAVQVGVNAILFDGIAKIMVGGATGGGSDGDFIYGPYSKHTSTYDLIPDLICEDLNGDGQCDNRRLTNSNTAYQIVYEEGGGENGLSLRFNGTNIQYGVRINNRLEVIDYSYDLVPNQYTNFTIGFNEGEMELYINGSKVATNNNFATTGISTIPQHLDPAGLAGIAGTGTIWEDDSENVNFHGMIDYFGYTNKTLTEAQITNLTTPTNNNNARQIKNNHSKKVKQNIATKEPHLSIFPNPVKDELNILLEVQQAGSLNLSLFDLNGKQVYEMRRRKINQGHQLITLKNLKIKAGQHVLNIKAGNINKTKKVLFD